MQFYSTYLQGRMHYMYNYCNSMEQDCVDVNKLLSKWIHVGRHAFHVITNFLTEKNNKFFMISFICFIF